MKLTDEFTVAVPLESAPPPPGTESDDDAQDLGSAVFRAWAVQRAASVVVLGIVLMSLTSRGRSRQAWALPPARIG